MRGSLDLFVDQADNAFLVDQDGNALTQPIDLICCAVEERELATSVCKEWEVQLLSFRELTVRLKILHADTKDHGIFRLKLTQLIPERVHFGRSATGEIFGVEREDHVLLTTELFEAVPFAIVRR